MPERPGSSSARGPGESEGKGRCGSSSLVLLRARWLVRQESPPWETRGCLAALPQFIHNWAVSFLFGPMQFSPLSLLQVGHHLVITGTQPYGSCHPILFFWEPQAQSRGFSDFPVPLQLGMGPDGSWFWPITWSHSSGSTEILSCDLWQQRKQSPVSWFLDTIQIRGFMHSW